MKVVFQMDENINCKTDTTFLLIKEARNRNHEVFIYTPHNLALRLNQPIALAQRVSVDNYSFIFKEDIEINLNEVDIVFIRQDPPFNMRYITTTYILEKTNALVINNPTEIRNCPEKLITSLFPDLIPPTLITENTSMIKDFFCKYEDIILKPLYSYGGNDVVRIQDESSIQVVTELMIAKHGCPIIAQLFCKNRPSAKQRNKRQILFGGYKNLSHV